MSEEHYDDGEDFAEDDYDEDIDEMLAEIDEIENPIERQKAAEEKLNG